MINEDQINVLEFSCRTINFYPGCLINSILQIIFSLAFFIVMEQIFTSASCVVIDSSRSESVVVIALHKSRRLYAVITCYPTKLLITGSKKKKI